MTGKPKILLVGELCGDPAVDAEIREISEVTVVPRREPAELVELIKKAVESHGPFQVFAGTYMPGEPVPFRWRPELVRALGPHCRCYCRIGAGYDDIDVDYITSIGAIFANAPVIAGQRTANGAITLLLTAMSGLLQQDRSVRNGGWSDTSITTRAWSESTIGIIGLGKIGARIARFCSALEMKVVYNNRRQVHDSPFEYVSLDELLKRSDVIIVACPLTNETRHILNKSTFEKMKDGVIIVNIGRGSCIDEAAMVEAIESRKILRAALDVFENEPHPHPGLVSSAHTILSPHNAVCPDTAYIPGNVETLRNAIQYIKTGMPNTPINLVELEKAGFKLP